MKPELRRDPISGRLVLIAPERMARPGALLANAAALPGANGECPFCEGNERMTPPESYAIRDVHLQKDSTGWRVRVVPNQFPAVRAEVGVQELIVECPEHESSLAALSDEQLTNVLLTSRERLRFHKKDGRWLYGQWFKNHGAAAGASLPHAHSQLIALPVVPGEIQAEVAAVSAADCGFCKVLREEIEDSRRLVHDADEFVALCPYASRFPFEMWLLPRAHCSAFEAASDDDIKRFATFLRGILRRLDVIAERPAYNLILHSAPWTGVDFHWHVELLPRVTGIAGFELGAGIFINPLTPEDAAARLRAY